MEQGRVERGGAQHELEDALVPAVGLDQPRPGLELRVPRQQRRLQGEKRRVAHVFAWEDERAAGAGLLLLLLDWRWGRGQGAVRVRHGFFLYSVFSEADVWR